MPLLPIWKSTPETVKEMTIVQIVANAGDGNLRDNSIACAELREYLGYVETETLESYADQCLTTPLKGGGFVLQDLVNELGRRLEYTVENGLYQGRVGEIGFDGLWRSGEGNSIIVEVKTTDAYRMNLDTIANYRNRLIESGTINSNSSVLIIVGRSDTGDIEAQVRGSKHAWDIRLISVDALIKLVLLKEAAEEEETTRKIQSLLIPFEYTRLDNFIDVMFYTARDVEQASESSQPSAPIIDQGDDDQKHAIDRTSTEVLNQTRRKIVEALAKREGTPLIARGRALFWSADHAVRAVCTISKRYEGAAPYWYAYHPAWASFLQQGSKGFFALGCVDLDIAFAIPHLVMAEHLGGMIRTVRPNGIEYWHVKIYERGPSYALQLPLTSSFLPLDDFALAL